jgi:hypothetical protein
MNWHSDAAGQWGSVARSVAPQPNEGRWRGWWQESRQEIGKAVLWLLILVVYYLLVNTAGLVFRVIPDMLKVLFLCFLLCLRRCVFLKERALTVDLPV